METKINLPKFFDERETREWMKQVTNFLNNFYNVPDDSTAATVSDLKDDFNALLQHVRDLSTERQG